MENKLQSVGITMPQQNNTPTEINLPGDGNTLIAHADNVKNEYKTMILVSSSPKHADAGDIEFGLLQFNCCCR